MAQCWHKEVRVKAATLDRYGPPEVLRIADVPKPVPAHGEILVRVRAAAVSAGDVRLRLAKPFFLRAFLGLLRPRFEIPGMMFSGVVEAVGKNAAGYAKGDEVFGSTGVKFGANAEYACAAAGPSLATKPHNASFDEAAAIPFGGVSALHFLRAANVQSGQRVLIYGASGSVGTAMVQLAKHLGARVTGVCSTANLALVSSLGADEVLDYTRQDFSAAGAVYDVVIDAVGKASVGQLWRSVKPGGACVFVASTLRGYAAAKARAVFSGRARVIGGIARTKSGDLDLLKGLIEAGKFKPVVDRIFPLDDIVAAHRYAEAGHVKGNVVIKVG
jgi:NADPH:quinone reductase-like Zn-dependent oxidoreductase